MLASSHLITKREKEVGSKKNKATFYTTTSVVRDINASYMIFLLKFARFDRPTDRRTNIPKNKAVYTTASVAYVGQG